MLKNRETLGAIDIGSNAIRLVISYVEQYDDDAVENKKACFVRIPIRLGTDVFKRGHISSERSEALCDAMSGFAALMRAYGVRDYRACATSAMREAVNGQDVVDLVRLRSGIRIETISGEEEADTVFAAGGLKDILDKKKNYLYVDVGGGSTEVVVYARGQKAEEQSFRLGTVRIISGAADPSEWTRFEMWLARIGAKWKPSAIIGSGGNINKVHKMLEKKRKEAIKTKEIKELFNQTNNMTVSERMEKLYLNQSRAEVIVPALQIFYTVAQICDIEQTFVPRLGLADGIINKLYQQYAK